VESLRRVNAAWSGKNRALETTTMDVTDPDDKLSVTPLARLHAPLGGQDIELQQIDYRHGGLSLLRIRIREGRRFTVFDIDASTAATWGEAMLGWSQSRPTPAESS
jgi:hypothetical protein